MATFWRPVKIGYDFGLLFTAICPFDGDLFAIFLPNMSTLCFDIFQNALKEHIEQKTGKVAQIDLHNY
jgi:hypothetical protein